MERFSERSVRFHGVRHENEWRLKRYSITCGDTPLDQEGFAAAWADAVTTLPAPSADEGRPGLGFTIEHQGISGDYMVLCWWSSENELPIQVWVRRGRDDPWRPAKTDESVCVWDLEVIWHERQSWVSTMLVGGAGDAQAYLAAVPEMCRDGGG